MQIEHIENKWTVTHDTPAEEAILQLIIPSLPTIAPEIQRWMNCLVYNVFAEQHRKSHETARNISEQLARVMPNNGLQVTRKDGE